MEQRIQDLLDKLKEESKTFKDAVILEEYIIKCVRERDRYEAMLRNHDEY